MEAVALPLVDVDEADLAAAAGFGAEVPTLLLEAVRAGAVTGAALAFPLPFFLRSPSGWTIPP